MKPDKQDKKVIKMCVRCYDVVNELFEPNCKEKPEFKGQSIGQYHCPDCGAMLLAGILHGKMCKRCLERKHPAFDKWL